MATEQEQIEQIQKLTNQLATVSSERDTLKQQVATITTERDNLKTEASTLSLAKVKAENDALDALKVVSELKQQLASKQAGTVQLPTVSYGKETYELVGGDFNYFGRLVTIDVLKEDSKLVAELLKEKVSHLRKLDKSAAV